MLNGERHGRQVSVRLGDGRSEVKVTAEGGPESIVVTRKGGEQADWLCDLWLAELLAAAA